MRWVDFTKMAISNTLSQSECNRHRYHHYAPVTFSTREWSVLSQQSKLKPELELELVIQMATFSKVS